LPLTPASWTHYTHSHCYFAPVKAHALLGFTPQASSKGLLVALLAVRARCGPTLRAVVPLGALSVALLADALALSAFAACAAAASALSFLYGLLPPPSALPPQPPLPPPLVSGGVPLLGHLLDFIKGPVHPTSASTPGHAIVMPIASRWLESPRYVYVVLISSSCGRALYVDRSA
jgi:hypothetical protein